MSDGSRGGGRQGGFGRRSKKTVQRQRTAPDAPGAMDQGDSLPARLLLGSMGWFFDTTPPDPNNEPWQFKHFLTINIFLLAIPGAIGIFVFDDWHRDRLSPRREGSVLRDLRRVGKLSADHRHAPVSRQTPGAIDSCQRDEEGVLQEAPRHFRATDGPALHPRQPPLHAVL